MTGNDLIAKALRLINVLASGEIPTAAEAQDALITLNQMLESWSTQQLQVFTVQRSAPFNSVNGQQVYTLGTGGNFNLPRPPYIQRIGVLNQPQNVQPLELPLDYITAEEWADIPVKNIQSALPLKVWDDRNFPFRNLSFWPIPNVAVQFVIYFWQSLNAFPDLVTDITFPPGYSKAILYNLAIDLAPEYGVAQVPPGVEQNASTALAYIQSLNEQTPVLRCDPAVVSPELQIYNWFTDNATRQYRG